MQHAVQYGVRSMSDLDMGGTRALLLCFATLVIVVESLALAGAWPERESASVAPSALRSFALVWHLALLDA